MAISKIAKAAARYAPKCSSIWNVVELLILPSSLVTVKIRHKRTKGSNLPNSLSFPLQCYDFAKGLGTEVCREKACARYMKFGSAIQIQDTGYVSKEPQKVSLV